MIKTETKTEKAVITIEQVDTLELDDMVWADSYKLFEIAAIDTAFLDQTVSTWKFKSNRDYQKAATDACALTVVNDPAERAVCLVKFLKQHHFKPKDHYEFQQQMIAIDVSRRRDRPTKNDEKLLEFYLNAPTLAFDELTDDEDENVDQNM